MSTASRRNDWDREERDALAGVEEQIEAMRRRHADDPPFDLLRAAHADALPSDLQESVAEHISGSAMSRTLAEGLGDEEPALSLEEQHRLLARIAKEVRRAPERTGVRKWLRPLFLGSAVAVVASVAWLLVIRTDDTAGPEIPAETTVAVAEPPTMPFLLPFDKPEVRVGLSALTWRGSTGGNQLLADLKPALDAYRAGDYATADRELTGLADRYPGTIEILFYQGVSRLFLDDRPGAIASFIAAESATDRTLAADVSYYRAVAEQRAGNVNQARSLLETACQARNATGDIAARACVALDQLNKSASSR